MEKKPFAPGQHGAVKKFKSSEYGIQLREKQKAKRYYGILENQFRIYFEMAERMPGRTGENLLVLIERRLDNVVIKSGLFKSKQTARQFITHGHILVNGKRLDIPSYLVEEGDVIKILDKSKDTLVIKQVLEEANQSQSIIPSWLNVDLEKLESKVIRIPNREDITVQVNEQLIVELYSK
jgi:small subunit ribosomal protein S4